MLAFCSCGHQRDEHVPGRGCRHVNRANARRAVAEAVCSCARFVADHALNDSDAFIGKMLTFLEQKERIALEPVEREDLRQVMTISLWRASVKYDSRSHIRFGNYAAFEIYNDAIDEMRSSRMFGRQGQYRVRSGGPADGSYELDWVYDPADPVDHHDAGADRLARVVAELTVDAPDAGSIDLRWAATDRDRAAVRAARERRFGTAPSVESRARGSAWDRGLTAFIHTTQEVAA